MDKKILRIIDANFNRLREGLRVCEEVVRFFMEEEDLTPEFKKARHLADRILRNSTIDLTEVVMHRDSDEDVGRESSENEMVRSNIIEVFSANIERVKESLRVLEEFCKLSDPDVAEKFKSLRFKIYTLEKETIERLYVVCNIG